MQKVGRDGLIVKHKNDITQKVGRDGLTVKHQINIIKNAL